MVYHIISFTPVAMIRKTEGNDIMSEKRLLASSDIYDVYERDGFAVREYNDVIYKEKCLYAALTHARVETTLVNSFIKIPTLHEVSVVDGRWSITMDFIKGKTMQQLMDENPENMDKYLNQFIDIQTEIHAQYMPLLSKLKDKMTRQIKSLGQIDEIKKYELLTRLDSMPKHIKLCHGNFAPKNIIINDEGTYVINWGSARQGNASADVARTYLLLCLNDPELAEPYLDKYCLKSGTSKQYVQAWLPIVAAAQLIKGKAEEKDLLMKWIDVVDYS